MMKVERVRIEYGRVFNLGDYETLRIGVSLEAAVSSNQRERRKEVKELFQEARNIVMKEANHEIS